MQLSEYQLEIIRLLKVLEVNPETIIPAMLAVQDNDKAEAVLRKVIELEDNNEELTSQKLLRIMAEI